MAAAAVVARGRVEPMWLDDQHYARRPATTHGSIAAARQLLTPSRQASHHHSHGVTLPSPRGRHPLLAPEDTTASAIAAATAAVARSDGYERTFVPYAVGATSSHGAHGAVAATAFVVPTALNPRRLPPPPPTGTLQWRVGGSGTAYPPLPLPSRGGGIAASTATAGASSSPSSLAFFQAMMTSPRSITHDDAKRGSITSRSSAAGRSRKPSSFTDDGMPLMGETKSISHSHGNGSMTARAPSFPSPAMAAALPNGGANGSGNGTAVRVIESSMRASPSPSPSPPLSISTIDPSMLSRWQIDQYHHHQQTMEDNTKKKSRTEVMAEEKAALFAFVAHPTSGSALLPSLANDNTNGNTAAKWTDQRIDDLWYAGGGGSSTFFHIQQLLHQRKTFATIDKLIAKVKSSHAECRHKEKVMAWLLHPNCLLWHPRRVKPTVTQVDELYHKGGAGRHTLAYLKLLEREGWKFSTMIELITAVTTAHHGDPNNKAKQRGGGGGAAPIVWTILPEDRRAIATFLARPQTRLFAIAPHLQFASKDELNEIIIASGHSVADALFHLQTLDMDAFECTSFGQLTEAIRVEHSGLVSVKKEYLALLQKPDCHLVGNVHDPHLKPVLSMVDMDRLWRDGAAGHDTPAFLNLFMRQGRSFPQVDDLVTALQVTQHEREESSSVAKHMLFAHLSTPGCRLFSRPLTVTANDIDDLFMEGRSGQATLLHVEYLLEMRRKFGSIADLIVAVRHLHRHSITTKTRMSAILNDPECRVLNGMRVPMDNIDRIWEEGRAGPQTVPHIWFMCATNARYTSVEQLISAIGKAHDEVIHDDLGAEKWRLVAYIADNTSSLFHGIRDNGWPSFAADDIDRLLDLGGGDADKILFHIKEHATNAAKFESLASMYDTIRVEHQACDDKLRVLRMLTGAHASLASPLLIIQESQIDELYSHCGAQLLPAVQRLSQVGMMFDTFNDLDIALRIEAEHLHRHQQQQHQQQQLQHQATVAVGDDSVISERLPTPEPVHVHR